MSNEENKKNIIEESSVVEAPENKELEECQKLRDEYLAGWKRAQADFINYKKNEVERFKELKKFVNEDLLLKILPILDNLYIAENEMPKNLKEDKWLKGILQIKKQILDFFGKEGIEEIKAVGEKFNPEFHEAVEEIETEDKKDGIIAEEIKKGYILNGRVIRPAKVKITK